MDNEQLKILAVAAGAIGAAALAYQLCKPKRRCITITGTTTANGSIVGRSSSKEMDLWIGRIEAIIELGALAHQAWQNIKERRSSHGK